MNFICAWGAFELAARMTGNSAYRAAVGVAVVPRPTRRLPRRDETDFIVMGALLFGADDPDCEHAAIHQVRRVILAPNVLGLISLQLRTGNS